MKRWNLCSLVTARSSLTALLMTICSFVGIKSIADEINYTLDLSDLEIKMDTFTAPDGNNYIRLSAPGCEYFGEPGEPMIPYKVINFLVPTYSNNFFAEINDSDTKGILQFEYPVYPAQRPQIINEYNPELFDAPDSKFYSDSSIEKASIVNEFFLNGDQHIVSVAVPVIGYNPIEENSMVFSKVDIMLNYQECDDADMTIHPRSYPSSPLDWDISDFVVNVPKLQSVKNSQAEEYPVLEDTPYYYILTPQYLEPALKDLAAWKRQKGHTVVVKTFEDIYADTDVDTYDGETAFDPESKVRNWLKRERDNVGRFKLLIIGDEEARAPIRKYYRFSSNKDYYNNYWSENYYPSDSYFSDLSTKFNFTQQSNGYFSCITPHVNYDIPVGRILADKSFELSNYFKKLLIYELDPGLGDTSYLNRGMTFFQQGMMDKDEKSLFFTFNGIENITTMNDIRSPEDSFSTNRPTGTEVMEEMSKSSIMSLHGHGSPYTIRTAGTNDNWEQGRYIQSLNEYDQSITNHPNSEINNGFDNLNNPSNPAILYTISCDVAPFDYMFIDDENDVTHLPQGLKRGTYSLAKSFTVAGDFGGPVFIGNTREGYVKTSDKLEQKFGEFINRRYNIGDAMCLSANLYTYDYVENVRTQIGDPDIKIWSGSPQNLKISATFNGDLLKLMGKDVAQSRIVLYDGITCSWIFNCPEECLSFQLQKEYMTNMKGSDFMVTILKDGYLPKTNLFADGSIIADNLHKNYFMNEGLILRNGFFAKSDYCYNIFGGGKLSLNCTRSLETNSAFEINDKGHVEINAGESVELKSDVVKQGGSMTITAPNVILGEGFTVKKGGTLFISPK